MTMNDVPANSIHLYTRAAWRDWLAQHHTRNEGVWLITYKKKLVNHDLNTMKQLRKHCALAG